MDPHTVRGASLLVDSDCLPLSTFDDKDIAKWVESFEKVLSDSSTSIDKKPDAKLRPRRITACLRRWIKGFQSPFPSLADKQRVATALEIHVTQVNNFCNNYRKRYIPDGAKSVSFSVFHMRNVIF